jgi:hypothetical protein
LHVGGVVVDAAESALDVTAQEEVADVDVTADAAVVADAAVDVVDVGVDGAADVAVAAVVGGGDVGDATAAVAVIVVVAVGFVLGVDAGEYELAEVAPEAGSLTEYAAELVAPIELADLKGHCVRFSAVAPVAAELAVLELGLSPL